MPQNPSESIPDKATDKTGHIVAALAAMLRDGRPTLRRRSLETIDADKHPHTPDEQIILQLNEQMYQDQTITSRPGAHYETQGPDELAFAVNPDKSKPHDVRNRYHPISQRLAKRGEYLLAHSPKGAYICGIDAPRRYALAHQTKQDKAPSTPIGDIAIFPDAQAYIVPAYGDIICAYEMMAMLNARLSGDDTHPERPILIDNNGDYWKYLLWHLEQHTSEKLGDYRIHSFREGRWHDAEALLSNVCTPQADPATSLASIPPHSLILVGTKTNEKILELQELFEGTGVRVMRLDHFANFQDPAEVSGTFAGNAMEKIRNAHKALRQRAAYAPERLRSNILLNCPDPEHPHVFILSEDSGLHMEDKRISHWMQKEGTLKGKVKDELILYHDQFPGVEFGPAVSGAMGEQAFWDAVNDVIERHKDEPDDRLRTRNRGVVNSSVLAISPFHLDAPDQIQPVYMFSGTNMSMLLDKPTVEAHEIPNTAHYLSPVSQMLHGEAAYNNPLSFSTGKLSQAELGPDYLAHHSARTFAAKALRIQMGLPEEMTLDMPTHPLAMGIYDPDSNIGDFDARYIGKQTALGQIDFSAKDWPEQAEAMCATPDVYYLNERLNNADEEGALFNDLFRFSSLIVSKQLVPRDKDKLMTVYEQDASWAPFLALYDHLRHIGMANDQQNTFIRRFKDSEHLNLLLKQSAQTAFVGEYVSEVSFHDKALERLEQQPKNQVNIAMFCSATSKNQTFNHEAERLGAQLARKGYGMVFGAADKEMMGSARIGYVNAKHRASASKALLIGASTQDILPIESTQPQAVIDSLDVYLHAEHIYERMQFMMHHSDAFAIYPGGVGTVQELMLLLCAKRARNPNMAHKPILLYNRPLHDMGVKVGFYDPLITMLGINRLEAYGVTICTSEAAMFEAIDAKGRSAS